MKRITKTFIMTALLFMAAGTLANAQKTSTQINSLVSSFKHVDGFEVVNIGAWAKPFLRSAMRSAMKEADDPEAKAAIEALRGIKSVIIIDHEDAGAKAQERFNTKLARILEGEELLMEAKDESESLKIYGVFDDNKGKASDIIFVSSEALIYVKGSIDLDTLSKYAEKNKEKDGYNQVY